MINHPDVTFIKLDRRSFSFLFISLQQLNNSHESLCRVRAVPSLVTPRLSPACACGSMKSLSPQQFDVNVKINYNVQINYNEFRDGSGGVRGREKLFPSLILSHHRFYGLEAVTQ